MPIGRRGATAAHRVVIIGSGFGGLFAAKALRRAPVEVTVVAATSHHLFQPLLYQVATGILSVGEVAPVTREVLSRQQNAQVLLGTVTRIDLAARVVHAETLGRQTQVPFDSLIVAAGSSQSYFGNDHFAAYAPGMKSVDDALELRGRIFGAFEIAELAATRGEPVDDLLTIAIVGAGPTGVEMAGQIAELTRRILQRDFRAIDAGAARVVLIDAVDQVLPAFGSRLGARARAGLERAGVEVLLGATVTDMDARSIELRMSNRTTARIGAVTKIWAAGVKASPLGAQLAEQSGATLDRAGRVYIEPDLTLPGHPEVFVIGDMIAKDGLPGVAQVAIQSGRYAARTIERRLQGLAPPVPFEYHDKGSMAIISRFRAVAKIGRVELTGLPAWLAWLGLHLIYITGFKTRVTALLHWAVAFLGRSTSERAITEQQVFGRAALARVAGGSGALIDPDDTEPTSTS